MSDNNLHPKLPGFPPLPPLPGRPGANTPPATPAPANPAETPKPAWGQQQQPEQPQPVEQAPQHPWGHPQPQPEQQPYQGQPAAWGQPKAQPNQQVSYPATGTTANPYHPETQVAAPKSKTLMIVLISLGAVIVLGIIGFLALGFINSQSDDTRTPVPVNTQSEGSGETTDPEAGGGTPATAEELDTSKAQISVPPNTDFGYDKNVYISFESSTAWEGEQQDGSGLYYTGLYTATTGDNTMYTLVPSVIAINGSADQVEAQKDTYEAEFEKGFFSTFKPGSTASDFESKTYNVPAHAQTGESFAGKTYYVESDDSWSAVTFIHDYEAGTSAAITMAAVSLDDLKALTDKAYTAGNEYTIYYDQF